MEKEESIFATAKDFAMAYLRIKEGIDYAIRKQRLCLVFFPISPRLAHLNIIQDDQGAYTHLAMVIPRSKILLQEMTEPNDPEELNNMARPWEMLIDEEEVSLAAVLRNIKAFIHDYYREVDSLPISFFRMKRIFRLKEELASIAPDNTVQIKNWPNFPYNP